MLLDLELPGENGFTVTREPNALMVDTVLVLCPVHEADGVAARIARSPAAGFPTKERLAVSGPWRPLHRPGTVTPGPTAPQQSRDWRYVSTARTRR